MTDSVHNTAAGIVSTSFNSLCPSDAIDLGQHWPSNALQLQVITRTNADFSQ